MVSSAFRQSVTLGERCCGFDRVQSPRSTATTAVSRDVARRRVSAGIWVYAANGSGAGSATTHAGFWSVWAIGHDMATSFGSFRIYDIYTYYLFQYTM